MRRQLRRTALALVALAAAGPAAADSILFADDFDAEPVQLNVTEMNQWTVEDGTIDVVANGAQGLACPSAGQCVDLDGSTRAAGRMVSNPIRLPAGTYVLSYQLSGNQRGGDDTATIHFGTKKLRTVTLPSSAPFKTFSDKFALAEETTGSVAIQNLGGDFVGLVLDNVSLTTGGAVVTGAARAAKHYHVACQNLTTGQKVTARFDSLQTWDCVAMGLSLAPGETFKATVEGLAK